MLRPLSDKILVKRTETEERTPGGLYIPGKSQERPNQGVVVAVGRGRLLDSGKIVEPSVKPGDVVLFSPYAVSDAKPIGDDHVVISESEILGVME